MKIKTNMIAGATILLSICSNAQIPSSGEHRQLASKRVIQPIKIDGKLDEADWKNAPALTGYTELRPTPGRKEFESSKTESYLLYDNEGIYFGGYCHEKTKDSISTELNGRDGFGNNDWIGVVFDTYDDKINGFEYFVTPLGEQMDAKISPNSNGNSEDFSWNAVWKSAAVIHEDGWSFEMFIPFSAIRFSKKATQNWGLNVMRRRQKIGQQVFWNTLDPNVNGFLTQNGVWTGLENIKPPLRLQFSPYFSTSVNHFPYNQPGKKEWTSTVGGGMDVKYGISQAFTLDVTLIPDFSQVQSDRVVLNLTPFEQRFTENRPFFIEGTDLFSKGNLFYARRMALDPAFTHDVSEYTNANTVVVKEAPAESKLVNATKISGRTGKGLGIGILNGITKERIATLEDINTKERRNVVIEPLTNYNIIVLDQSLKNNSNISLVNTNVWRSGNDYDANVTAGLFNFNDKKNMWNVNGKIANSRQSGLFRLYDDIQDRSYDTVMKVSGYSHSLGFGKTSGRFNFQIGQDFTNDKFSSRDFGYFQFGNTLDHYAWIGYRWTKPKGWYNNIYLNFNAFYSRQAKPGRYRNANFNANANGQMKNLWYVGMLVGYEPEYNDFFEAHKTGKVFRGWSNYFVDGWFETNNAKKFRLYAEVLYVKRSLFSSERYQVNGNIRYRFSNKFSLSHSIYMEPQTNNAGYAYYGDYFNRRDRKTVENSLEAKYSFSDKMNIRVIGRHYWSKVISKEMYDLQDDGTLKPNTVDPSLAHQNFNLFTVDANFTWQFAPGSFIYVVWKNAAQDFNQIVKDGYFKNFDNTMKSDDNNNLSLKVIYFLDYLQIKKKKKDPK